VLHLIWDKSKDLYGYANEKGDTVIPLGKYPMCFTDTFNKFAIVLFRGKGFVGIDRKENILFNIYPFDNGPDDPACGLFRIIKNGRIGYADLNGKIVIQPQFDCAYPFEKNKAKVGIGCKENKSGEHYFWSCGSWHTVDFVGNVVKE
jgi:hypothetical protein